MSILQEYEKIRKDMGSARYDMIGDYLDEMNKYRKEELFLSDVLYKEKEYKGFEKWFNKQIYPFRITDLDTTYSVILFQDEYWYDWQNEIYDPSSYWGDGHCYDQLFHDYFEKNYVNLLSDISFDSENGMFCIYADDIRVADEVAVKLSALYKDKEKMIDLIKETKKIYGYEFDDIHI